jgi:glycosyltransferase involved in cell wall biosynthesis
VRIFFGYPSLASFVSRDLKILREKHTVCSRNIRHRNPIRLLADLWHVINSDLVFLWFASIYALPLVIVARLFRKNIIVVVGGYEAVNLPEIAYGSARSPMRRRLVTFMLRCSTRVIAVSKSSMNAIISNLRIKPDQIVMLYHGFEDIAPSGVLAKDVIVVNVGQVTEETWLVKGIYDFIQTADAMPDVRFLQIGRIAVDIDRKLGRTAAPNLITKGEVPFEELVRYLGPAKVYLQLSRHESFGCSVAEAMLFQCIPVVTNAYALPEVVGDCGIVLGSAKIDEVVFAVRKALAMPASEGVRARERILQHFPYQQRRDALLNLLELVANK